MTVHIDDVVNIRSIYNIFCCKTRRCHLRCFGG